MFSGWYYSCAICHKYYCTLTNKNFTCLPGSSGAIADPKTTALRFYVL